jgi:hypothetical protein
MSTEEDNSYKGTTFVAFMDISGFKKLMKTDTEIAKGTLNDFYNTVYKIICDQNSIGSRVEGTLISDCAMLFVRNDRNPNQANDPNHSSQANDLDSILKVIKKITQKMIKKDIMLTTSIAYGGFEYQYRIENNRTRKNYIYGDAYLNAYLDNENGIPKIQPGQCRLVKENVPNDIIQSDKFNTVRDKNEHYYYYWMVSNPENIETFINKSEEDLKYLESCKDLKYRTMTKTLKHFVEKQT